MTQRIDGDESTVVRRWSGVRQVVAPALCVLMSGLGLSVQGAEPAASSCPDQVVTTGAYRNHSYGFKVTLPRGVEAQWNSARCAFNARTETCSCMPDHGRDIDLGTKGSIVIFASYTDRTLASQVVADIEQFKDGADEIDTSVRVLAPTRLAGLPAFHYVAVKEIDGVTRYREAIVAQAPNRGIEYTIAIEASEATYRAQRRLFQKLVVSWRLSPRN